MFYKYLKLHYDIITNSNPKDISKLINFNKKFIGALKNIKYGGVIPTREEITRRGSEIIKLIEQFKKLSLTQDNIDKIKKICSVLNELIDLTLEVNEKLSEDKTKALKHQLEEVSNIISQYK
jgi:hypothetical protein